LGSFRAARAVPAARTETPASYCAVAPAGELPGSPAPELDPDPELEPMPGHECFPGGAPAGGVVPVFAPAGGVVVPGVVDVVVGVADCAVEAPVPVEPEDAAPALEMPASAPPVASAPATIVAPSNFDVFMRSNLHLWVEGAVDRMVRRVPKSSPTLV
jgi:hypothetical protein